MKNDMHKKMFLLTTFLFCLFNLNAQEKNNIKLGIESGILPLSEDSGNLGLLFYVEPKIRVLENTFFGLRFGLTLNSHVIENNGRFQFSIDDKSDHAVLSFVPTIDYYFSKNSRRPYLGLGFGYHLLPYNIDVSRSFIANPSDDLFEGKVNRRIGFLLRGGIELGKFRFGLEYNFIPTADIKILNDLTVGTVDNNYLGLSIGFLIIGWESSM